MQNFYNAGAHITNQGIQNFGVVGGGGAVAALSEIPLPHTMVMVAKDNEWVNIRNGLVHFYKYECTKRSVNGLEVDVCIFREDPRRSFYVVFLGGQGKAVVEKMVPKFLMLRPKYITTVGICGGLFVGQAMFITTAVTLRSEANATIQVQHKVEKCANLSDALFRKTMDNTGVSIFARREGEHKGDGMTVLSISDLNPPEEARAVFRAKLNELHCQCQDMEIAFFWDTIRACRPPQVDGFFILPAIKVGSDDGSKEDRKRNEEKCCFIGARAISAFLEVLIDFPIN